MNNVIEVKDLVKKYKNFQALYGIDFEVPRNHIVGFLGPNGAGKTTTLRILTGLCKATSGTVEICGIPVEFGNNSVNKHFGYLPELPTFYNWMTGKEYLEFIGEIFNLEPKVSKSRVGELLELTGLTKSENRAISSYSNGMKQRLGVAQALINDPDILIMDEPVSSLDPEGRKEIIHIIEDLKNTKTILFSTHILSDVDRICDDIVIINHGKVVANGRLVDLKSQMSAQVLEIEFLKNPKKFVDRVKKEKWLKHYEVNSNVVKLWVEDMEIINKNVLLKIIEQEGIGLLNYGLKLPTAEDLFMHFLQEDKNERTN